MVRFTTPPDTQQGVAVELRHIVKDGWELIEEAGRFRIRARSGTLPSQTLDRTLREEAWRIAHFVAYTYFVSISRRKNGNYTIISKRSPGEGFEIVIEAEK